VHLTVRPKSLLVKQILAGVSHFEAHVSIRCIAVLRRKQFRAFPGGKQRNL